MPEPTLTRDELHQLRWSEWLSLLIGLLSVIAGIIVISEPSHSLKTLAVIFGIFVLIDGIAELVAALIGATENRGLLAVIGALSVIAGVLLIRHPLGGVRAVALLLGIWLIAVAVVRLVVAFAEPEHRLMRVAVALILGIFGVLIVANPNIGYGTLAVIAGIGFLCYGATMLVLGWGIRRLRHHPPPA